MFSLALLVTIIVITTLLTIAYVFQINVFATLIVFAIILFIYLLLYIYTSRKNRENRINNNLIIARKYLLDNEIIMFIIHHHNKLIWANDKVYDEFPVLLRNKNLKELGILKAGNFEYRNNIYNVITINSELIYVTNVTSKEREKRNLVENQANIGILQIDNYNYLENHLTNTNFINLISNLKTDLIKYFANNKMYYEEIEEDKYQVIIPTSVLHDKMNTNFNDLDKLADSYHDDDHEITFSFGISTNQKSIARNGIEAKNAFDLALTRGGGQVVVFDGELRKYFGGTTQDIKGSLRLKARILGNTIANLVANKDVIYLFTHNRPDSDALASTILLSKLIEHFNPEVSIRILFDNDMDADLKYKIEQIQNITILYDIVLDRTKDNLAIICDTQSSEIVAHKNVLDNIEDKIIIDHHQTPINFIEDPIFSWVETNSSSTTEMVSEMMLSRNVKFNDKKIADLGILGIMTDSSNLQYRTDANTLEVLSFLVENGGEMVNAISSQYLPKEIFKMKLSIISKVKFKGKVALVSTNLTNDDFILSVSVNEIVQIKGIDIGMIVSEGVEYSKVKLRSKNKVNVKTIIEKYGGGGHPQQAAGLIKNSDIEKLIKDLEEWS